MADTRLLLDGLENYRTSLQRHLSMMQAEFQHLQGRWQAFSAVYAGDAANEFKPIWHGTSARFDEYILRAKAIVRLLDERIEQLRKVNREEGVS